MLGSNNTATVTRLLTNAQGHTTYATAVLTSEPAYIERMSLSEASLIDAGNPYEVYELIVDSATAIKINDKVVDAHSREYRVASTQPVNDFVTFQKVALKAVIQ